MANTVIASSIAVNAVTPSAVSAGTYSNITLPGANTGTNSPGYVNVNLQNNDTVYCIVTDHSPCVANGTDTSNKIGITVHASVASSVSIMTPALTLCTGDSVRFTADPVNGGSSPSYQWQIDGNLAGTNQPQFITRALADGDQVDCIMTANIACSPPAVSGTLSMTVNPVPLLVMGPDTIIRAGTSVALAPSVAGNIVSYTWTPASGLNDPSIGRPIAMPDLTTTYRLQIVTDKGCAISGKTTIRVYAPLQMPNAFTPNGDGKNDQFRIPAATPQKITRFSVYNRWGQPLFVTADSGIGWDGTFNGQPQPAGTYVWEIEFEDILTGRKARAGGTVELIR